MTDTGGERGRTRRPRRVSVTSSARTKRLGRRQRDPACGGASPACGFRRAQLAEDHQRLRGCRVVSGHQAAVRTPIRSAALVSLVDPYPATSGKPVVLDGFLTYFAEWLGPANVHYVLVG